MNIKLSFNLMKQRAVLWTGGIAIFLMISFTACSPRSEFGAVEQNKIKKYFDHYHAVGTFVIRNDDSGEQFVYNESRAETGFLPASTFKIMNSLIALNTKVIQMDDVIPWNGVKYDYSAWNQDQRMREAFQRSTVWFYQILAGRIGAQRMLEALEENDYGNHDIGGGIDQFWLSGNLRISALEQVQFLEKLKHHKLRFPVEVMTQVEELLVLRSCPSYVLRGKTGWTTQDNKQLGWLVGWLEWNGKTYFYAMNLDSGEKDFPMAEARKNILSGILREMGFDLEKCDG